MEPKVDYREKSFRVLAIYDKLIAGEGVNKKSLSQNFGVTEKTLQRDIDELKNYLFESRLNNNEIITYKRSQKAYFLEKKERDYLTKEEILAICKIILESRAFCKEELEILLDKLRKQVAPSSFKQVEDLLRNELFYYVPLHHGKALLQIIWELSSFILNKEIISFSYTRQDLVKKEHKVKPVAIMFSEYYFYLISYLKDKPKNGPTIFRVDRIDNLKATKEKFFIPYRDKFDEGEFRKRVQFMYSGELKKIKFKYKGSSLEAVLDRLPTAKIMEEKDGIYTITVEVYGNGINMWLKSQGDNVEMIPE